MEPQVYAFRITHRGRPRTGSPPHISMIHAIPTQADCESCRWCQVIDAHRRCNHPTKGCPSCATRIDPWTHPAPCPLRVIRRPNADPAQDLRTGAEKQTAPGG